MGASGSKRNREENTIPNYMSSILISFSKIKEIASFFRSIQKGKDEKELSKIYTSLVEEDKDEKNGDKLVEEFNNIIKKEKVNKNVDSLIKFILETLHKELNKSKKVENTVVKTNPTTYQEYITDYRKNNDSIIQNYFLELKKFYWIVPNVIIQLKIMTYY